MTNEHSSFFTLLGLQLISSSACPDVVEQISSAVVSATIKGSPSQPRKGKRIAVGSLLTHINGVSTAGMTLAQTIERLKSVRSTRKQAWVDVEEKKKKKKKKKERKKKSRSRRRRRNRNYTRSICRLHDIEIYGK